MDEPQIASELEQLLMTPFYLSGSVLVLELLATILIFAGVIVLFTSSKRPGRIMMLVSLAMTTLCLLPIFFLSEEIAAEMSAFDQFIIWYLPVASSLFMCIGSYGFFKFALSFKNES